MSANKPVPYTHTPQVRSYGYYPAAQAGQYPGLGDYPGGFPGFAGQQPDGYTLSSYPAAIGGGISSNLFSSFSLKDLPNLINRLGGIDGIINTMGKIQKIVSGVQQMAPMLKLIAGSLLPGAKSAKAYDEKLESIARRKRRRRRRRRRTFSFRRNKAKNGSAPKR